MIDKFTYTVSNNFNDVRRLLKSYNVPDYCLADKMTTISALKEVASRKKDDVNFIKKLYALHPDLEGIKTYLESIKGSDTQNQGKKEIDVSFSEPLLSANGTNDAISEQTKQLNITKYAIKGLVITGILFIGISLFMEYNKQNK